ncbi:MULTISPECIES: GAF domain-containing sensor histidine kinase [Bacillus]|uniref:GAF domain-containing sensor histidine kinase n=1 Tax=Bacillus TaxID=1386 RepID=UPI001D0D4057|nr:MULTISPECIES: GAF domain-containing sensor histidine kinase [Bacillus]
MFCFKGEQTIAQLYMMFISSIGWLLTIFLFFQMDTISSPVEFIFLFVFLAICELYPMPVPKGFSTLTFPVLYMIYVVYGVEITVVSYFIVVLGVNLLHRRPIRIIFFNPAQLAVSLYLAHLALQFIKPVFLTENFIVEGIVGFFLLITCFYLLNNIIVDIVLILRPERYTFKLWKQKGKGELISFTVSFIYGVLMHILGSQNRGEIDIISYFFFFSPLVALSLLSSIIVRLRNEKNRLKSLFDFSSELNKAIPNKDGDNITRLLKDYIMGDDCILLLKHDEEKWAINSIRGSLKEENLNIKKMESVRELLVFDSSYHSKGPLHEFFSPTVKAEVYAPLLIDEELVGCLIVTKTRTKSFTVEEIRTIATIANQLAIFFKTRFLFLEKEQRVLLEERNRIAHDIHDGIAQNLAGAVMKLDTSLKKIHTNTPEAIQLIEDSSTNLRKSLRDVRDSIYALKPYPTEQLGFLQAVEKKVSELNRDSSFNMRIDFNIRGEKVSLSSMTEKIMFKVFQESLQNCIKHALATKVNILLSYQADHVVLKISDNGIGFSLYGAMIKAMEEPHYGILQMNEAAEKIGAALQIESKEKEGTNIILKVPKMGLEGVEKY